MFPQCVKSGISAETGSAGMKMAPSGYRGRAEAVMAVGNVAKAAGKGESLPSSVLVRLVFSALRSISAFPVTN
jgi:Na+/H+-translocating membrane pyrophosphatase